MSPLRNWAATHRCREPQAFYICPRTLYSSQSLIQDLLLVYQPFKVWDV